MFDTTTEFLHYCTNVYNVPGRRTEDPTFVLRLNEVFVFGSNLAGHHGAGAARTAAEKFGAKMGVGIGLQGESYAIPSKDHQIHTLPVSNIKQYVDEFIEFAKDNPDKVFLVTEIGCGLAGHSAEDIAPLFDECLPILNVHLPGKFWRVIIKNRLESAKTI